MFRVSPADIKRQFKRLGIKVDVEEVKAEEVVVRTREGKELVMESPQTVFIVKFPGNVVMLQAVGNLAEREAVVEEAKFSEDDVRLVAEQAGVSLEEARQALEEAGGDIAAAILLLQERKQG